MIIKSYFENNLLLLQNNYPIVQNIIRFVENYGYVEHLGLGIPEKIIKPMLERGYPEPQFFDNGYEFIVILRKN